MGTMSRSSLDMLVVELYPIQAGHTTLKVGPPENHQTAKVPLANRRNFSGTQAWLLYPLHLESSESIARRLLLAFWAFWWYPEILVEEGVHHSPGLVTINVLATWMQLEHLTSKCRCLLEFVWIYVWSLLLMCVLAFQAFMLWFDVYFAVLKVFWCSLMNYWCVWTFKCYLEVLYQNVYSSESTLPGLDGGLSLCCCENPLHFSLWHLYSTRGSFPQSLGALINAVPKLVVCILQPEWAIHRRCWSAVLGKILVSTVDTLH